jgi:hypothetical protein
MDTQDADDKKEPEEVVQPPQSDQPGQPEQADLHQQHADEPEDDFAAASRAVTDYSQFTPQLKPKKKWPRVLGWTLLVLVVIAALGAGGYWLASHKSAPKQNQSSSQKNNSSNNQAQNQNRAVATTEQYQSTNFNLSFNHPQDWAVADTGNGKLTVTSPTMQLTDASGQSQAGQVVMSIQNKDSADLSMFKQGNAIAVLDSQKIAYTKPTSTQRADTYVSFLQYAATTTHGALDGVYITGDAGYQKGQYIPESDITKVDPLIRVTFVKCANASCSGTTTPLSISSSMWTDPTSFSGSVENILKSLAIQ